MHITSFWNGSCHETGEHLSEQLDGELRGLRRFRIDRHLARCELCQAVLRSLIRTLEELRLLGKIQPTPAPSVVPTVMVRIREER
ncbi:MAG: zf-HC2 domain-containing protein [Gaiellaceae bacterium]